MGPLHREPFGQGYRCSQQRIGNRRFGSAQCALFAIASPVPIIAVPISLMIEQTSAKSRLTRRSLTIRSVMQATPEQST
jgi:hypothetical protein